MVKRNKSKTRIKTIGQSMMETVSCFFKFLAKRSGNLIELTISAQRKLLDVFFVEKSMIIKTALILKMVKARKNLSAGFAGG